MLHIGEDMASEPNQNLTSESKPGPASSVKPNAPTGPASHSPIHFGTSGWRAVIADEFTFDGVRLASRAIAAHLRKTKSTPEVLVGCDTRFLSPEFARAAAEVLRAEGCHTHLCDRSTPTPALAFEIRRTHADGAINITASHNPANYNGLKFSGPDGGPALPEVTKDIEEFVAKFYAESAQISGGDSVAGASTDVTLNSTFDPREPYFAQIEKLVRFDVIQKGGGHFVYDALHGCGAGYLDELLTRHGISVSTIRANRDVLFDGTGPDPSEDNVAELRKEVAARGSMAGLATDGDADRFGIIDRNGAFISPNHILGLVFDYLLQTRSDSKLGVARSVATTHLLDAVARKSRRPVFETPVGFKYIGALVNEGKILLGGEESAGMSIENHLPEKDGILACLLVAEMIAARRTSLAEQLRDLFKRVGAEYWPVRVNISLPENAVEKLQQRLRADFGDFAGHRVVREDRTDGLQLLFDDDSWILMRPSGTEPVVRVYAEAHTTAESQKLAEEARKWVLQ
jgi:alpha-D-glucose phosphate-specific phosphoglucomutase